MKITIKLDKRKAGETVDGFPIVIYVTHNYKNRIIRTGYCAKVRDWNERYAEPKKSHPSFYVLSDYLTEMKSRIKELMLDAQLDKVAISEVKHLLLKKNYSVFFDEAMEILGEDCRDSRWSALRAWDGVFPRVAFDEVTPRMVEKFKSALLKKGNKPAGVDSYLRSLRALWNKCGRDSNPFSGYSIVIPPKVNTVATMEDLRTLSRAELKYSGEIGSEGRYRDYFLLMFYLGGIDPEVLAKLRYDTNYVDGRIVFNRDKGGSVMACNNIVPASATEILEKYDCKPYFVPIFKAKDYTGFMKNFNNRFKKVCEKLNLSKPLKPKTPRYTFIDRAQQLLIDERITAQIVGHKRKTTTSLYSNDFPLSVQDEAHLKIICYKC